VSFRDAESDAIFSAVLFALLLNYALRSEWNGLATLDHLGDVNLEQWLWPYLVFPDAQPLSGYCGYSYQ